MKNKKYIWGGIVVTFLIVLGFFWPIPYYIEEPGEAFLLDEMIQIEGDQIEDQGTYSMTTVGVFQATPLSALSALSEYRDLMTEEEMLSGVSSDEEYELVQELYMKSSINHAIQVAYDAAGASYETLYDGIYVMQVIPESDFLNDLQVGDLIRQVDGQEIKQATELIDYLADKKAGDVIDLLVEREGHIFQVSGTLTLLESGQIGIGVALVDDMRLEADPPIDIDFGNIGGPSAGLLYSLYIYEQLTEGNLSGGRHISGTGTISPDGSVGAIGGAGKKVIVAEKAGADIFFVPNEEISPEMKELYPDYRTNYEEALETAKDIGSEMAIVPVKHFNEALEYLENHL